MILLPKIKEKIESKLVYKPSKQILPLIEGLKNKVSKKSFLTDDNLKLTYWHIKDGNKPFKILFCHGNLFNISSEENQKLLQFLTENGYEVFAIDYRGFGQSDGNPNEAGLYKDVEAMVAHIQSSYKINRNELIIWGHSLGSAMVIDIASRQDFAGVIIEGGFTSIEDMKNYLSNKHKKKKTFLGFIKAFGYSLLPVSQKFESKEKIAGIKSPTLIMHTEPDEIVPFKMGVKLAWLKPDAMTYFTKEGTHINFDWQKKGVLNFLENICSNSIK